MSETVPVERLRMRIRSTPEVSEARAAEYLRDGRPVRVGDLFVLAQTAESGLEWLVVADGEDLGCPDTVQIVPADTTWLAGSADVSLPTTAGRCALGPLVVRCGRVVSVPATSLKPTHRTGFLAPEAIEQVLAKLRQLEGEYTETPQQAEAEADPEYRWWNEQVVERALRNLMLLSAPVLLAATVSWVAAKSLTALVPQSF